MLHNANTCPTTKTGLTQFTLAKPSLEDFLKPMGVTARQLAADIDVSPSRISEIINGKRPITADTALRLGLFFSMESRFWLNLQTEFDMRIATRELASKIAPRIRVLHQAAA